VKDHNQRHYDHFPRSCGLNLEPTRIDPHDAVYLVKSSFTIQFAGFFGSRDRASKRKAAGQTAKNGTLVYVASQPVVGL